MLILYLRAFSSYPRCHHKMVDHINKRCETKDFIHYSLLTMTLASHQAFITKKIFAQEQIVHSACNERTELMTDILKKFCIVAFPLTFLLYYGSFRYLKNYQIRQEREEIQRGNVHMRNRISGRFIKQ